ncbi:MAG: hypothetical protein WA304_02400 [Candidatus Cybelea sp.]
MNHVWRFAMLSLLAVVAGCGGQMKSVPEVSTATTSDASSSLHRWRNDIGPRYQWNHNYGYCGEVSEISAGLYYGQYLSQYDARAAADDAPQNRYRSQLLLGVNALRAAETMHLRAIARTGRSNRGGDDLLAWVKENVLLGRPVAIGIYMNQFRFYGNRNPNAGSPQYDHIVPVTGIESSHPRDERGYFPDDTITFSDNGEWSSRRRDAQYYFSYAFGAFQKTRRQANAHHGPIYSLTDDHRDYGIAILGVQDEENETLPVRVTTNINYEHPQIVAGSAKRPPPEPLELTITVSGLTQGAKYDLYRYDTLASIPDGAFNKHASKAHEKWVIAGRSDGKFVMTEKIMSDDVAAYRAVPAGAP